MTGEQFILVLLAAFWAGSNVVLAGFNAMNATRNTILLGDLSGKKLSWTHRKRLLYYDWLSMRLGLAGISIVLTVIIMGLPSIADPQIITDNFLLLVYITAFVPFCGFLFFLVFGFLEYRYISKELTISKNDISETN